MADETPESKKLKLSKRCKVPIEIIPSIVQSTVDKRKSVSSSNNKTQAQKAEDIKSLHAQVASDVDVEDVDADEKQNIINDEDFDELANLDALDAKSLVWDEVEMKKHGLVDAHAHHKLNERLRECEKCKATRLPQTVVWLKDVRVKDDGLKEHCCHGHLPFDEVEMKHTGFLDDHCHRMVENVVNDKEDISKGSYKHIQFDDSSMKVFEPSSSATMTVNMSSDSDELILTTRDIRKSKEKERSDQIQIVKSTSECSSRKERASLKTENDVDLNIPTLKKGRTIIRGVLHAKGKVTIIRESKNTKP